MDVLLGLKTKSQKTQKRYFVSEQCKPCVFKGSSPSSVAKKVFSRINADKPKKSAYDVTIIEVETNPSGTGPKLSKGIPVRKMKSGELVKYAYKMKMQRLKEPKVVRIGDKEIVYKRVPMIVK
tara:strand:+ start:232 stop:600 length:369 start_codon:yes stop_codon:yes gene_type:complete